MSHAAGGVLAGFLWQVEIAFWTLLRADFGQVVTIEVYDDVAVSNSARVISCIQAKHSEGDADVTAYSSDLWKTLGIWLNDTASDPDATRFMCTTRPLGPTLSVLSKRDALRSDTDRLALLAALDDAAKNSTSDTTKAARTDWRKATKAVRARLLATIQVLEEQPKLAEVHIRQESQIARLGFSADRVAYVRQHLHAWFFETVNRRLKSNGASVTFDELHAVVCEKHDTMSPMALTSTMAKLPVAPMQAGAHESVLFLRQLALIDLPEAELQDAHIAHSRAEAQRLAWLNGKVTNDEMLGEHDGDLEMHWRRNYNRQARERAHDEVEAGRAILSACSEYRSTIRGQNLPGYVTVGTFHILADEPPTIGWHLNWHNLIRAGKP